MNVDSQVIGALILIGWTAMWWLAVRTVFGHRFGRLEWIPVAIAALGVPGLIAESTFRHPQLSTALMIAWTAVVMVIDTSWLVHRWRDDEA